MPPPSCRPRNRRTSPVSRSSRRTLPSWEPSANRRPSALTAPAWPPTGCVRSTRSVAGSISQVASSPGLVTNARLRSAVVTRFQAAWLPSSSGGPSTVPRAASRRQSREAGPSGKATSVCCTIRSRPLGWKRTSAYTQPGRFGSGGSTKRRRRSPVRGSIRSTNVSAVGRAAVEQWTASASVRPSGEKARPWTSPSGARVRLAEARAGRGVVDDHGAALVADRHEPVVVAERQRVERPAVAAQLAERRRLAHEQREQVAARGGRVVELDAGAREQQGLVDPLVGERLGAEPLGVGDERGVARLAALGEGDRAGDDREHEQRRPRRPAARAGGGWRAAAARPRPPRRRARRRGTRARARLRSSSWAAAHSDAATSREPR